MLDGRPAAAPQGWGGLEGTRQSIHGWTCESCESRGGDFAKSKGWLENVAQIAKVKGCHGIAIGTVAAFAIAAHRRRQAAEPRCRAIVHASLRRLPAIVTAPAGLNQP
jgi:hypothetical protein